MNTHTQRDKVLTKSPPINSTAVACTGNNFLKSSTCKNFGRIHVYEFYYSLISCTLSCTNVRFSCNLLIGELHIIGGYIEAAMHENLFLYATSYARIE